MTIKATSSKEDFHVVEVDKDDVGIAVIEAARAQVRSTAGQRRSQRLPCQGGGVNMAHARAEHSHVSFRQLRTILRICSVPLCATSRPFRGSHGALRRA